MVAFSNNAEYLNKYAVKGNKVGVQGKLHVDNYKDDKGVSHKRTYIVVDNVEILSSKKSEEKTPEKDNFNVEEFEFPF